MGRRLIPTWAFMAIRRIGNGSNIFSRMTTSRKPNGVPFALVGRRGHGAMDMRFYHDGMGQDTYPEQIEGLNITYEDYEPEFVE